MSDWATDMAIAMQPPAPDSEIMIGKVVGVSPLKVSTKGETIAKYLYLNPAYRVGKKQEITTMFTLEINKPTHHPEIMDFLKSYHEAYVIDVGDTVVLLKVGVSFYVLSKVV